MRVIVEDERRKLSSHTCESMVVHNGRSWRGENRFGLHTPPEVETLTPKTLSACLLASVLGAWVFQHAVQQLVCSREKSSTPSQLPARTKHLPPKPTPLTSGRPPAGGDGRQVPGGRRHRQRQRQRQRRLPLREQQRLQWWLQRLQRRRQQRRRQPRPRGQQQRRRPLLRRPELGRRPGQRGRQQRLRRGHQQRERQRGRQQRPAQQRQQRRLERKWQPEPQARAQGLHRGRGRE